MKREAKEIIKGVRFIIEDKFAEPSCREQAHILDQRSKTVTRYIINKLLETDLNPKSLQELQEEINSL
jgi:hypothetical protein